MSEIAIVDRAQMEALAPAEREAAVTVYLQEARGRLALAVEATGPHAVAALKAEAGRGGKKLPSWFREDAA